jgi:hypothetical protein
MSGNSQPQIDIEEHTYPFGVGAFGAKMVVEPMPPAAFTQKLLDYDIRTDSNPVYVGFNFQGAAQSATNWVIQKLTYDGSARVTMVQIAVNAWTNRVSAIYS